MCKTTGVRFNPAVLVGSLLLFCSSPPSCLLLTCLLVFVCLARKVITDLSEYGRVISFDRPGFGKTERVIPPAGLPWRLCPQTLGENPYSADFAAKALFGILDRSVVRACTLLLYFVCYYGRT